MPLPEVTLGRATRGPSRVQCCLVTAVAPHKSCTAALVPWPRNRDHVHYDITAAPYHPPDKDAARFQLVTPQLTKRQHRPPGLGAELDHPAFRPAPRALVPQQTQTIQRRCPQTGH